MFTVCPPEPPHNDHLSSSPFFSFSIPEHNDSKALHTDEEKRELLTRLQETAVCVILEHLSESSGDVAPVIVDMVLRMESNSRLDSTGSPASQHESRQPSNQKFSGALNLR